MFQFTLYRQHPRADVMYNLAEVAIVEMRDIHVTIIGIVYGICTTHKVTFICYELRC